MDISKITQMVDTARDRAREFSQTRSSFQLEKFLAGDEYTIASKFRHVSYNNYVTLKEAERLALQLEEINRKKDSLTNDINNSDASTIHTKCLDLELIRVNRSIEDLEIKLDGMMKEIQIMSKICDELERQNGCKITYDQFVQEEPEYWKRRLASQMHTTQLGNSLGIGEGNYKAFLNAYETPILKESINTIPAFDIGNINNIAGVALSHVNGVNTLLLKTKEENV